MDGLETEGVFFTRCIKLRLELQVFGRCLEASVEAFVREKVTHRGVTLEGVKKGARRSQSGSRRAQFPLGSRLVFKFEFGNLQIDFANIRLDFPHRKARRVQRLRLFCAWASIEFKRQAVLALLQGGP